MALIIKHYCISPLAGASLQLVPMIMELVAPIKEPKALLNSRHELQARASRGSLVIGH